MFRKIHTNIIYNLGYMATADESLAGGGRKRVVERNNYPGDTFLRSTVMVLIPMSGPTYM